MSLLLIESFEALNDIADKYVIENTGVKLENAIVRTGSQSLECGANDYCKFPIPASATGVIGFGFYIGGATTQSYIAFFGDSTLEQVSVELDGSNRLTVERGATLLATSEKALLFGKGYFIEIKWSIANSIGADSFVVRVNGETWITLDAATDTQARASNNMDLIQLEGAVGTCYFDDLYILDLTGPAPTNDFLGDCRVVCLDPDGNGTTSDFVGSDSNSVDNYLHVDETAPDDDTSYVESSTVNHEDLYTFDNLAVTPDTIFGVQTQAVVKKDDAGARTGKLLARVGGTTYEGAAFSPSEGAYLNVTEIWELNPDDSAAWEEADVNGAEFGIKVES